MTLSARPSATSRGLGDTSPILGAPLTSFGDELASLGVALASFGEPLAGLVATLADFVVPLANLAVATEVSLPLSSLVLEEELELGSVFPEGDGDLLGATGGKEARSEWFFGMSGMSGNSYSLSSSCSDSRP